VSAKVAEQSRLICGDVWPVLTWEKLAQLQLAAVRSLPLAPDLVALVARWIGRSFTRYGIPVGESGTLPLPIGRQYGTEEGYSHIDPRSGPDRVARFLKGSECVEAVLRGERPAPPLAWLRAEPTVAEIRLRRLQTTEDRRVCRWGFDWSVSRERSWPR